MTGSRARRNDIAPYITTGYLRRDAGSAGNGATERRSPERLLQAMGLRHGMDTRAPQGRAETALLALCEA